MSRFTKRVAVAVGIVVVLFIGWMMSRHGRNTKSTSQIELPVPTFQPPLSTEKEIRLELWKSACTGEGLRSLQGLPVTSLLLDGERVTNDEMAALSGLPLEDLSLSNTWVTDRGLKSLQGLPIAKLHLTGDLTSAPDLMALNGLPITDLTLSDSKLTDEACEAIRSLPVRKLSLLNTDVSVPGFQLFQNLPLTHLNIQGSITDEYLSAFKCPTIMQLTLSGTKLSAAGLRRLADLSITELSLTGSIAEEHLKALTSLRLQKLAIDNGDQPISGLANLKDTDITSLSLIGKIEPDTIRALAGMKLSSLSLQGLSLDESGVEVLHSLHRVSVSSLKLTIGSDGGPIPDKIFLALHGLPVNELSISGWFGTAASQGIQNLSTLPLSKLAIRFSIFVNEERLQMPTLSKLAEQVLVRKGITELVIKSRSLDSGETHLVLSRFPALMCKVDNGSNDSYSHRTSYTEKDMRSLRGSTIRQLIWVNGVRQPEVIFGMSLNSLHLIDEESTDSDLRNIRRIAEETGLVAAPRKSAMVSRGVVLLLLAMVVAAVILAVLARFPFRRRSRLFRKEKKTLPEL